jgi:hypothetical protein
MVKHCMEKEEEEEDIDVSCQLHLRSETSMSLVSCKQEHLSEHVLSSIDSSHYSHSNCWLKTILQVHRKDLSSEDESWLQLRWSAVARDKGNLVQAETLLQVRVVQAEALLQVRVVQAEALLQVRVPSFFFLSKNMWS